MTTVRVITAAGVVEHPTSALAGLIRDADGLVWVDIPEPDAEDGRLLSEVLGFHPLAVKDALERNRVPKAHGYADHVYFILHKPQLGEHGHVHYVELNLFVGHRCLVTVHGPVNPQVDPGVAVQETEAVLARLEDGRLRPSTPFELAQAVVTTLVRRHEDFLETVTGDVWRLEQRVMGGRPGDPEDFIDELFQARHGLLTVRTMAALANAICVSLAALPKITEDGRRRAVEMAGEFDRVRSVADGEREYLQGVIDFYQTVLALRASTATQHQNEELKRISAWAAILFAPTLVGTVYGMNFDHMPELDWRWGYPLALVLMASTSVLLHRVFRRSGWL